MIAPRPTHHCPICGSPLSLRRRKHDQETFWACSAPRAACDWTWPGDEYGPQGTTVTDGQGMPEVLVRAKDNALAALGRLLLGGYTKRAYAGQILDAEDLLDLGKVRADLRRIGGKR